MSLQEIDDFTTSMDREVKAIKEELFTCCWHLRGGLSISEAHELTIEDREIIQKMIKNHIEITKESKMPFF